MVHESRSATEPAFEPARVAELLGIEVGAVWSLLRQALGGERRRERSLGLEDVLRLARMRAETPVVRPFELRRLPARDPHEEEAERLRHELWALQERHAEALERLAWFDSKLKERNADLSRDRDHLDEARDRATGMARALARIESELEATRRALQAVKGRAENLERMRGHSERLESGLAHLQEEITALREGEEEFELEGPGADSD